MQPGPPEVDNVALDMSNDEAEVKLETDSSKPSFFKFKLEDGRYGQLTYVRIYQGNLAKDTTIINQRSGSKHRVGRLVRSIDEMEK